MLRSRRSTHILSPRISGVVAIIRLLGTRRWREVWLLVHWLGRSRGWAVVCWIVGSIGGRLHRIARTSRWRGKFVGFRVVPPSGRRIATTDRCIRLVRVRVVGSVWILRVSTGRISTRSGRGVAVFAVGCFLCLSCSSVSCDYLSKVTEISYAFSPSPPSCAHVSSRLRGPLDQPHRRLQQPQLLLLSDFGFGCGSSGYGVYVQNR